MINNITKTFVALGIGVMLFTSVDLFAMRNVGHQAQDEQVAHRGHHRHHHGRHWKHRGRHGPRVFFYGGPRRYYRQSYYADPYYYDRHYYGPRNRVYFRVGF